MPESPLGNLNFLVAQQFGELDVNDAPRGSYAAGSDAASKTLSFDGGAVCSATLRTERNTPPCPRQNHP